MSVISFYLPPRCWPIWRLKKDLLAQIVLNLKKKKKKPMERCFRANYKYKRQNSWNIGLGCKPIYQRWSKLLYHICGNSNHTVSVLKENSKTSNFNLWHSSCIYGDKYIGFGGGCFFLSLSLKYILVSVLHFHIMKKIMLNKIAGWNCFPLNKSSLTGGLSREF